MKSLPDSFAFYSSNGLSHAWKDATKYAGPHGHIATLPEILTARTKPGMKAIRHSYFTTSSAEYAGLSKSGTPLLIVAHGNGPLTTIRAIEEAYSHHFTRSQDGKSDIRGGRVSQEEFLKLESGHYGDVAIQPLQDMWAHYQYPFLNQMVTPEDIANPNIKLWRARLGPNWEAIVNEHVKLHEEAMKEQHHLRSPVPCVFSMGDASNAGYSSKMIFDHHIQSLPNTALAHLLSIGQVMTHGAYYTGEYQGNMYKESSITAYASDISCHERGNGSRILAVQGPTITSYASGISYQKYDQLQKHPERLLRPYKGEVEEFFEVYNAMFTEASRGDGACMATGTPKFPILKKTKLATLPFQTTIGGYHGFVKYAVSEARAIAPEGANAFEAGEFSIVYKDGDPEFHACDMTFYRLEVDTTQQKLSHAEIENDYDLTLQFATLED